MPKIKADSHGVYVQINGSYFRPFLAKHSYTYMRFENNELLQVNDTKTKFKAGDEAKVKFIRCSPHCSVASDHHIEYWHTHGSATDDKCKKVNSEDCWIPDNTKKIK